MITKFPNTSAAKSALRISTAALLALTPPALFAADLTWDAETDDYFEAANWAEGTAPTAVDNAIIGNGGTAQLETADPYTVNQFRVGWGALSEGVLEISGGGTVTNSGALRIGVNGGTGSISLSGEGTVLQNSGTGATRIGEEATGSTGVLTINSGASYLHTSSEGGAANTNFWVGAGAGNSGTININGGTLNKSAGANLIVGDQGGTGTMNQTSGTFNISSGAFWVGAIDATGSYSLESGTATVGTAMSIGRFANSNGTVTVSGGTLNHTFTAQPEAFTVGMSGGTGILNIQGGQTNVAGEVWIGQAAGSTGTVNISGGEINVDSWLVLGRAGGSGTVVMTDGVLNHTAGAENFFRMAGGDASGSGSFSQSGGVTNVTNTSIDIGHAGTGEFTLSNTGEFHLNSGLMNVAILAGSQGTVNLDGGLLATNSIVGGEGTSTVHFNGGTVRATADQENFISNLTTADLGEGGLTIDTNGFALGTSQNFTGSGAISLTGSGSASFNGTAGSSSGITANDTATLRGTGSFGGASVITVGAFLAPGNSIGTMNFEDLLIEGALEIEFDGAATDQVFVTGNLELSDATLVFSNIGDDLTEASYTLITYDTLTGKFGDVQNLPAGYTLDYEMGGNSIGLVIPEPSTYALLGGLAVLGFAYFRRRSNG